VASRVQGDRRSSARCAHDAGLRRFVESRLTPAWARDMKRAQTWGQGCPRTTHAVRRAGLVGGSAVDLYDGGR